MKRTKKVIRYHGRSGRPVVHKSKSGKKYIVVRATGGGTKRLYQGSQYTSNGKKKRLRI